ncbi:hypothetical protein AB1046_07635 [Promicromonospora sp. Populi]|uniref:hypothetical protein n=1 Tax=Promicromonospora sp. Populi TaxID=3239420 RepID=UPI0034E2BC7A
MPHPCQDPDDWACGAVLSPGVTGDVPVVLSVLSSVVPDPVSEGALDSVSDGTVDSVARAASPAWVDADHIAVAVTAVTAMLVRPMAAVVVAALRRPLAGETM